MKKLVDVPTMKEKKISTSAPDKMGTDISTKVIKKKHLKPNEINKTISFADEDGPDSNKNKANSKKQENKIEFHQMGIDDRILEVS